MNPLPFVAMSDRLRARPSFRAVLLGLGLLVAATLSLALPGSVRAMAETGAIVVGGEPKYLLSDPAHGLLYVSQFEQEEIAVVNLATGLVIRRVPVPGSPVGLALGADGGLYVASYFGNSLTLRDAETGLVRVTRAGVEAPWDVKVVQGPGGRSLVAVTEHHADRVTFLDPLTLVEVGRVSTGYYPYQMAVNAASGVLYVVAYGGKNGGEVTAIDLNTLKELWTTGTGGGSFDVAVDPIAGRVLVTDFVGQTVTRLALDGSGPHQDGVPGKPKAGVFAPDGTRLWVALQTTGQVVGVDPALDTVTQTIRVGSLPGPMVWMEGAPQPTLAVGNQGDGTISLLTDGPPVPEFTDVLPSHPLHLEIRALALRGAIGGYDLGDGTFAFRPDAGLMRAQIAKILVGSLALHTAEVETEGATAFADVPVGTGVYPYDYVQEASRLGLVNGFATRPPVFKPYIPVTRIQLLRMAVRAASAMGSPLPVPAGGSPFYDIGPGDPDLAIIKAAHSAGLVSGTVGTDGRVRLKPYADATRGETAHVVFALLGALHRGRSQ